MLESEFEPIHLNHRLSNHYKSKGEVEPVQLKHSSLPTPVLHYVGPKEVHAPGEEEERRKETCGS